MKNLTVQKAASLRYDSKPLHPSHSTKYIKNEQVLPQLAMENYELVFPPQQYQQQLAIYQWRIKTQFPIVKVTRLVTKARKTGKHEMKIRMEGFPIRLEQLKELPLFKIIYILKESIIGFEGLFDKFGPFPVTSRMIAFDQQNKCKVWINEAFQMNEYIKLNLDESLFVKMFFKIMIQCSNKLKSTAKFFTQLNCCSSFCQTLAFIEAYARENKIKIPHSCIILPKELVAKGNKNSPFNPCSTMSRAPKIFQQKYLRNSHKQFLSLKSLGASLRKCYQKDESHSKCVSNQTGDTADIANSLTFQQSNFMDHIKIQGSLTIGKKSISKKIVFQSEKIKMNSPKARANNVDSKQQFHKALKPNIPSIFLNFASITDEEDDQITKMKEVQVFSKNNWEKCLSSLISDQEQLKKSYHVGPEKSKTETTPIKLRLLDSVSPEICSSFMEDKQQAQQIQNPL